MQLFHKYFSRWEIFSIKLGSERYAHPRLGKTKTQHSKKQILQANFFENTLKMNDEPINLTKPLQFGDSEPINLTLLPKSESYEPMETALLIEKIATRKNCGTMKYLSCAVTVPQKIYLLPMRIVHLLELLQEMQNRPILLF